MTLRRPQAIVRLRSMFFMRFTLRFIPLIALPLAAAGVIGDVWIG